MARMTGFVFQDKYLKRLEKLSDQEVGRLVRALAMYHMTGEDQELKGRECGYYDFIKGDIDEIETAYQNKCKNMKRTQNYQQTPIDPNCTQLHSIDLNCGQLPINKNKKKNKEEEKEEETRTHDDGPFGLTDEDIHASLLQDQQIEEAAKRIGLQTTEAGMMKARDLVRQYNLEAVLDAISKSVDVPKWAYVEGVLRGGKNGGAGAKEHRGNHNGDHEQPSGKYAFLFTDV